MTPAAKTRFQQPPIKRLGFDDGWSLFCNHFLGIGLPMLFVDNCILGRPEPYGMVLFGKREPISSAPAIDLHADVLGNSLRLYTGNEPSLIAEHWFRDLRMPVSLYSSTEINVVIGDSYALEVGWSELWRSYIGRATSCNAAS